MIKIKQRAVFVPGLIMGFLFFGTFFVGYFLATEPIVVLAAPSVSFTKDVVPITDYASTTGGFSLGTTSPDLLRRWQNLYVQYASTSILSISDGAATNTLSSVSTSTFAEGISIAAGCFETSDGNCLTAGTTLFTGLTDTQSSLTANRVIFTNSGGTALTDLSTFIFDGTNFGVGTTTPGTPLSVTGDAVITGTTTGSGFVATSSIDMLGNNLIFQPDARIQSNLGTSYSPFGNAVFDQIEIIGRVYVDAGNITSIGEGDAAFEIYGDASSNAEWFTVYDTSNATNGEPIFRLTRSTSGANHVNVFAGPSGSLSRFYLGGTTNFLLGGGSAWQLSVGFTSDTDSTDDLGSSSIFWDEIFGDELVVNSTDGVSATAANQVRLSGLDLSAGDAGLNIRTEDDTDYLFASRAGFASTTPWGQLSVEAVKGVVGVDNPIFVVGDKGTSTPMFYISANGNIGIGTATPASTLDVTGTIRVTETYLFSDGSTQSYGATPSGFEWHIGTASFLQSTTTAIEDASPQGIFFKPDGLKMYLVGGAADDIFEYDLSTAWDVSTAAINQSTDVGAQNTLSRGLFIRSDGLRLWVVGGADGEMNEYNLTTAWDISTLSFSQGASLAENGNIFSVRFRPDGLKMYVTGNSSANEINEYDLSTAWDVSTLTFNQVFTTASGGGLTGLEFKSDGTKVYTSNVTTDLIDEYTLSTPWDISTSVLGQSLDVSSEDTAPQDLFIKPDATKIYVTGSDNDIVAEYNLGLSILGNVGVGTTTPWGLLSVEGTNNPLIAFATTTGATAFIVDSSGRVGIGTTTPNESLVIDTGAAYVPEENLTDASTIEVNWGNSNSGSVILGGQRTVNFSGGHPGQTYTLSVYQDGMGNRNISSWTTTGPEEIYFVYTDGTATTSPDINQTADTCSIFSFRMSKATTSNIYIGTPALECY